MTKDELIKLFGQEFFDRNNLVFDAEREVFETKNGITKTRFDVNFRIKNNYKKPYAKSLSVSFYKYKDSNEIYCRGYFCMPPACDMTIICEKVGTTVESLIQKKDTISSIAEYSLKASEYYLR